MAIKLFKVTFYEHPRDMPLWKFQKYLETQDLRYFTVEHKSHKDSDNIMTAFFGYYLNLTANQQVLNRFGIMHDILRYKEKYNDVMRLTKTIYNYPKDLPVEKLKELINQLEKWNYKVKKDKDIFEEIEAIYNRAQGIKTKIELLKSKIIEEDSVTNKTIESQIIFVERILELNYKIKAKEISVLEWIEYQKEVKNILNKKD